MWELPKVNMQVISSCKSNPNLCMCTNRHSGSMGMHNKGNTGRNSISLFLDPFFIIYYAVQSQNWPICVTFMQISNGWQENVHLCRICNSILHYLQWKDVYNHPNISQNCFDDFELQRFCTYIHWKKMYQTGWIVVNKYLFKMPQTLKCTCSELCGWGWGGMGGNITNSKKKPVLVHILNIMNVHIPAQTPVMNERVHPLSYYSQSGISKVLEWK